MSATCTNGAVHMRMPFTHTPLTLAGPPHTAEVAALELKKRSIKASEKATPGFFQMYTAFSQCFRRLLRPSEAWQEGLTRFGEQCIWPEEEGLEQPAPVLYRVKLGAVQQQQEEEDSKGQLRWWSATVARTGLGQLSFPRVLRLCTMLLGFPEALLWLCTMLVEWLELPGTLWLCAVLLELPKALHLCA